MKNRTFEAKTLLWCGAGMAAILMACALGCGGSANVPRPTQAAEKQAHSKMAGQFANYSQFLPKGAKIVEDLGNGWVVFEVRTNLGRHDDKYARRFLFCITNHNTRYSNVVCTQVD